MLRTLPRQNDDFGGRILTRSTSVTYGISEFESDMHRGRRPASPRLRSVFDLADEVGGLKTAGSWVWRVELKLWRLLVLVLSERHRLFSSRHCYSGGRSGEPNPRW